LKKKGEKLINELCHKGGVGPKKRGRYLTKKAGDNWRGQGGGDKKKKSTEEIALKKKKKPTIKRDKKVVLEGGGGGPWKPSQKKKGLDKKELEKAR